IQKKYNWIITGLVFGTFMFIFNTLFISTHTANETFSSRGLVSLSICLITGLFFGMFMKWYLSSKKLTNSITMNLFIKALLFLFIGTMANAQSFQGVITDLETGKPISQITIVSADQTYFVTSNEKGEVV